MAAPPSSTAPFRNTMPSTRLFSPRNAFLFSTATVLSGFIALRWRTEQDRRRRNQGTFHVEPARSGGGI
ncbi:uncharacterized protein K489DRAFT_381418 [Dissoconium aciculare CBS 342.82]|uniref:Uncharacterized protein n=1 Tax=Dissoconium aciculare CBS 342.82 TaxID=1314786 RepID=A0A6J3M3C3_9PEZI|nr:uncharacterized protein K489DRAFT_381418 [Dissoconium aciculare CBS 342.82]KAF1821427.1 hypothetical protein K489DRAFT_381418 [Dissoconium aciculare CBS 342.82]